MEKIGFLCLTAATLLASFAHGDKAESRQFSLKPYYAEESDISVDRVRFPDDLDSLPEDLDAAASVERIQGLKFYNIQNNNLPLIIYPVTNTGLTANGDDHHVLESMSKSHSIQSGASDHSGFEASLKNVAQGYIFPSSPATSHEEIFKQLLAAGSQGPAPEPYVIPTSQANKEEPEETIISIPQITHAYILEQPQIPVMAIINPNQQSNEPIYIQQHAVNDERQKQQEAIPLYSSDINTIPVETQYLQSKPSHYHMVGPHLFGREPDEEQQKDEEVIPTSPYREEPSKIPLHPPPPIKASTYGPPQTVHTPTSQPGRNHPPNHRPSSPPRSPPPYPNTKGPHSKGPPKSRPPQGPPYRLHSGPHRDHGHHHHHHHYHHESPHNYRESNHHHHHKEPHRSRPPPNHRPYEVHETKSPPHHGRPPPPHSSSHKHPYSFHHHHNPQKPSGASSSRPGSSSKPPNHHPEPPGKPLFRPNLQKGARPYGPPPRASPPASNSIGSSHPAITKAIFHPTHSPDLTVNQNAGPIKDLHGYTPGRYEYDAEPSATAHTTPSYSASNHDSRRPPDASPSASISEPYVTSPPRPAFSDEDDEETSPTVEVYSPMNDKYYGADSYQRMKEAFKPPVIVYKGVRPPVRVYQKPETGPPYHHLPGSHMVRGTSNHLASHSYLPAIDSTWASHNTASTPYYHQQRVRGSYSVASPSVSSKSSDTPTKNVADEIHITTKAPIQYSPSSPSTSGSSPTDSISSSSDDSSSWTPINAPAGAVPARAYHMPAPDLSRGGGNQLTNHHSSHYITANARADDEDVLLTEQNSKSIPSVAGSSMSPSSQPSGTGSSQLRRENNSEEVVSAVVLVKHR